ncbi:MAG TPA: hypothetical protein VHC97_02020 [Thermoanaerobaculia bacterium]|jgi:hypothetical protein|nr:hypothetical protein [Thermoanaerobaculia bacterium]
MSTLRLSFSGLCTFVFDPPLGGDGSARREATVLLQRLTRARALANQVNLQPEVIDQHFPLLEFNLADLQPESTRRADFHCFPDAAGRMTRGVCLLNGEDLTIGAEGRELAGGLSFSRQAPKDLANPQLSEEEQASLFWMVTLEDAVPGNAALNPKLLGTDPGSNQPILARVKLTEGRLRTRELTDSPYTVAGSKGSSSLNRRVATAFELEVDCGSKVRIRMVSHRNGSKTERALVLAAAGGGDVEVGIANMEIDRYVGLDAAAGPRVEADFEVYSDLLANPPAKGEPRPFLSNVSPGNSSGMGGVSGCVPVGW